MKKIVFVFALMFTIISCNNVPTTTTSTDVDTVEVDTALIDTISID